MQYYSILHGKFSYRDTTLFDSITFNLKSYDRIILRGVSGIGKSTLLQLIFGIRQWKEGEEKRNGLVHLQPQHDLLLPWKTVRENLDFTLNNSVQISQYLNHVGLSEAEKKYPHELSQGMKQRVAFLRTLLSERDILLFDEPFANLDKELEKSLIQLLQIHQAKLGFASVIVTHSKQTEASLEGSVWNLDTGRFFC